MRPPQTCSCCAEPALPCFQRSPSLQRTLFTPGIKCVPHFSSALGPDDVVRAFRARHHCFQIQLSSLNNPQFRIVRLDHTRATLLLPVTNHSWNIFCGSFFSGIASHYSCHTFHYYIVWPVEHAGLWGPWHLLQESCHLPFLTSYNESWTLSFQ